MQLLPLRLHAGDDLRKSLEAMVPHGQPAGYFVLAGIGSLANPILRLAGAEGPTVFQGEYEITSLSGTVTSNGAHLHCVVSDSKGRVFGGHVVPGNLIRTTAEVLLVQVEGWHLTRAPDPSTGYSELIVSRPGAATDGA